ncbi:SDR family oxidoreductase [Paracoccus caeni]|uniref:SDR family oxidoreductase n=1 Tax=Paracoccus caeni TaxID=657651 RepID=A0A934VYJ1_9RHOB|nr:SDR family oxidoreductase [Paracoccus caeni]MBK4216047.1 SDR family oxidoreductase [Paracoccus caeni]
MGQWTTSNMPRQDGRLAVVTGTGGLGYEDALALAAAGADVIIAGRNPAKGEAAVQRIRSAVPDAKIRFEPLDLADLHSVDQFSARMRAKAERLDLLINNAGVMVPPKRQETVDGFELQLGTNYLGHFALTIGLLPLLKNGKDARVVSLSSIAARNGAIDFADLNAERAYRPMSVYSQSKLACLIFALELHRRSRTNGWGIASMAAHPGVSRTDLLHNAPGRWSIIGMARTVLSFAFQPAAQGALPTLYAATAPEAASGEYYGPHRFRETRGYPIKAAIPAQAVDAEVATRLWQASEELTGLAA